MIKTKSKKKRRHVSFLIVPDDYAEPINFKLSMPTLKILLAVAIVLIIHILVGGIFYFQYYFLHKENVQLKENNLKLVRENSQIYAISTRAQEVESILHKLKVSLGIEKGTIPEELFQEEKMLDRKTQMGRSPGHEVAAKPVSSSGIDEMPFKNVKAVKSTFHSLYETVPTLLPVDGIISREFDKSEFHEPLSRFRHFGIDIAAKKGSVVRASGSGIIIFSGWNTDLGNLLIIYHGDGIFTYYAHNMRLLRESGRVKKGEPIALLGNTGKSSTAPHLHFEIWRDGNPVNPHDFIFALQNPVSHEKGM